MNQLFAIRTTTAACAGGGRPLSLLIHRIESWRWASFLGLEYIANTHQASDAPGAGALEVQRNAPFILRQVHRLRKHQMVDNLVGGNIDATRRFASRRVLIGQVVVQSAKVLLSTGRVNVSNNVHCSYIKNLINCLINANPIVLRLFVAKRQCVLDGVFVANLPDCQWRKFDNFLGGILEHLVRNVLIIAK